MTVAALDACSQKLPPYMVPTHIIPLTSMPLSANNKVDGHKLRDLYSKLSSEVLLHLSRGGDDVHAELTNHEAKIVQTLKRYTSIEVDAVRKSSSIFQLGLDSISVFGFAQALKSEGFRSATVAQIMNSKPPPHNVWPIHVLKFERSHNLTTCDCFSFKPRRKQETKRSDSISQAVCDNMHS